FGQTPAIRAELLEMIDGCDASGAA
ncbi:MAG: hypothetical protein JWM85_1777, partial [Acidimicrobiaceae bacterium]|nr:hypothetical protein [Acidimicrobiaceae bacterium]